MADVEDLALKAKTQLEKLFDIEAPGHVEVAVHTRRRTLPPTDGLTGREEVYATEIALSVWVPGPGLTRDHRERVMREEAEAKRVRDEAAKAAKMEAEREAAEKAAKTVKPKKTK